MNLAIGVVNYVETSALKTQVFAVLYYHWNSEHCSLSFLVVVFGGCLTTNIWANGTINDLHILAEKIKVKVHLDEDLTKASLSS